MGFQNAATGLTGRAEQTGLMVATAIAPGTFEPSLVPRSLKDQAVVTGLATTLSYVLTVATQDSIEAAASTFAPRMPGDSAESRQRAAAVLLDLAVIPAGLVAQRALSRRSGEPVLRGLTRQAAWRTSVTGIGGVVFALVQSGTRKLDEAVGAQGRLARFPIAVPAGLAVGWAIEARRKRGLADEPQTADIPTVAPAAAAAAGVGVAAAISAAAYGERLVATGAGALLSAGLPGSSAQWRLVGHTLCLAGLTFGGTVLFHRAMQKVEAGATAIEPLLDDETGHHWVGATVSGANREPRAVGHLGSGGQATRVRVRATPTGPRPPRRSSRPVDRDRDGGAGEGESCPGLCGTRQRADRAGTRRPGPR